MSTDGVTKQLCSLAEKDLLVMGLWVNSIVFMMIDTSGRCCHHVECFSKAGLINGIVHPPQKKKEKKQLSFSSLCRTQKKIFGRILVIKQLTVANDFHFSYGRQWLPSNV